MKNKLFIYHVIINVSYLIVKSDNILKKRHFKIKIIFKRDLFLYLFSLRDKYIFIKPLITIIFGEMAIRQNGFGEISFGKMDFSEMDDSGKWIR